MRNHIIPLAINQQIWLSHMSLIGLQPLFISYISAFHVRHTLNISIVNNPIVDNKIARNSN